MATTSTEKLRASLQRPRPTTDLSQSALGELLGMNNKIPQQIEDLQIALLDDHPEQSRYSMDEGKLMLLANSIEELGVLDPILVKPHSQGRFMIIAGHRRTKASSIVGKTTIPGIVMNVDDNKANAIFDATNLFNRETLLPSEKAAGYLALENSLSAISQTDNPSEKELPVRTNSPGTSLVAEVTGENVKQIFRYKRLTSLIPELLDMVDADKIPLYAGVALSYLTPATQNDVLTCAPNGVSIKQGEALKEAAGKDGTLEKTKIAAILGRKNEKKSSATASKLVKVRLDDFSDILPKDCDEKAAASIIRKALEYFYRERPWQKPDNESVPVESDDTPKEGGTLKNSFASLFKSNTTPGK